MPDHEPFDKGKVKALLLKAITSGGYAWSTHAREEMDKDGLDDQDCINVMRGGMSEPGEWERDSWRYRIRTAQIFVVVTFLDLNEPEVLVVTAWRKKR